MLRCSLCTGGSIVYNSVVVILLPIQDIIIPNYINIKINDSTCSVRRALYECTWLSRYTNTNTVGMMVPRPRDQLFPTGRAYLAGCDRSCWSLLSCNSVVASGVLLRQSGSGTTVASYRCANAASCAGCLCLWPTYRVAS